MAVIEFLFDHLAIVIGILIVLSSIASSAKKKQRAAEAEAEGNQGAPRRKTMRELMAEMEAELDKANGEGEETPHPYAPSGKSTVSPQREKPVVHQQESPFSTAKTNPPKRKVSPWSTFEEEGTSSEQTLTPMEGTPFEQTAPPMEGTPYEQILPSLEGISYEETSPSPIYGENSSGNGIYTQGEGSEQRVNAPTVTAANQAVPAHGDGLGRLNQLGLSELAKAVVFAEIIGKPKALR